MYTSNKPLKAPGAIFSFRFVAFNLLIV